MTYRKDFDTAQEQSYFAGNTLLWRWLQSDAHRTNLFKELRNSKRPILEFQSRITVDKDDVEEGDKTTLNQRTVYVLTKQEHIEQAFLNFSNEPYKALGTGNPVVLASNNNEEDNHELKRKILSTAFMPVKTKEEIHGTEEVKGQLKAQRMLEMQENMKIVIGLACHHALVLSSKQDNFDFVTNVAQEATLFFIEGLYGIDFSNHPVLHEGMEGVYDGMIYQMLARHFITEPGVPVKYFMGAGALITILDKTLQAALNPKLLTEIAELLARSHADVKLALTNLVKEISALEGPSLDDPSLEPKSVMMTKMAMVKMAAKAKDLQENIEKDENIAFYANQFIDHAMNLYHVRVWVTNELTSSVLDGSSNSDAVIKEDIRELVDLIKTHKKEKEAPDDNLIPVKFLDQSTSTYTVRETVIGRLAANPDMVKVEDGYLSGSEFLTELAGTISGTVGNFISGSSIAMKEILTNEKEKYFKNSVETPESKKLCENLVMEALRLDPPASFIPRVVAGNKEERTFTTPGGETITLEEGANVIIPMGALTHAATTSENPDGFDETRDNANLKATYASVFGQAVSSPEPPTSHRCIGEYMTLPFITTLMKNTLSLHNIALKEEERSVLPLRKKWGYICEKLPLVHKSEEETKMQPLNVVMKIKTPTAVHAEYIKKIIYYGAPVVDNLLESSNVVHFARFIILNDDTELALITTYDGGYDEYLEYFAEKAGPLFDMIFEHIQEAPPMPVRDNVQAFANHILRYDIPSTAGYFYSAYPKASVAEILRMRAFSSLTDGPEITKVLVADEEAKKAAETANG